MHEFKNPITIEMDEYKELLMIRGRYDELKNKELERKQTECLLHPKPNFGVREYCESDVETTEKLSRSIKHAQDECCVSTTEGV